MGGVGRTWGGEGSPALFPEGGVQQGFWVMPLRSNSPPPQMLPWSSGSMACACQSPPHCHQE